jgi:hypothetical protein
MKYDWKKLKNLGDFTEINVIIKFCDYLGKLLLNPK